MASQPVLEIAQPGYDIKTCTDDQKVFSSKLKTLKTKVAVTLVPNAEPYAHGLGYVPIHLYAGYLSTKPTYIGFVGQNTVDNSTNVVVDSTDVRNDSNDEWASSALVYVFIEQLV